MDNVIQNSTEITSTFIKFLQKLVLKIPENVGLGSTVSFIWVHLFDFINVEEKVVHKELKNTNVNKPRVLMEFLQT